MSARVKFKARILIDYDFYDKIIKAPGKNLLMKLMYVNARFHE
jgi:hypothetical protein